MTLAEIVAAFRGEIHDTKKPYLVSDSDAIRYANQAESEAARRSRLLVDSRSEVCSADVIAGDPVVSIDSRIISIRRARLQSSSTPLTKRQARQMDGEFAGWDASSSQSVPFIIVTDYGTNQLYLYPTPKADSTLMLTVTREPLNQMVADSDSPEIARRYHDGLINWMRHRAYQADDSDLYDAAASGRALAEFDAEFGPSIGAIDEQFEFEHYHDVGER